MGWIFSNWEVLLGVVVTIICSILGITFIERKRDGRSKAIISSLSFGEIIEKIKEGAPAQRDQIASVYNGIIVKWETRLSSVTNKGRNKFRLCLSLRTSTTQLVFCDVARKKYRELGIASENTKIIVQGKISEIDPPAIHLVNVNLDFPEA